jgi:hypothetical protein
LFHDAKEAIDLAEMEPMAVAEREPPASRRRGAEKMAHLVVSTAEPMCGRHALEPAHGLVSALDAAMILLEMIVKVAARPMPDPLAKLSPDGARIGIMAVTRCGVIPVTARAEEKNALAAAKSRVSLSRTSTRLPARSIAR